VLTEPLLGLGIVGTEMPSLLRRQQNFFTDVMND
jgi:hypothetical protein